MKRSVALYSVHKVFQKGILKSRSGLVNKINGNINQIACFFCY